MPPVQDWVVPAELVVAVLGLVAAGFGAVAFFAWRAVRRARQEADAAARRAARERERVEKFESQVRAEPEEDAGDERTAIEGLWHALRDLGGCATRDDVGAAIGRAIVAAAAPQQWFVFLAADADGRDFVVSASGAREPFRAWKAGARISSQVGKIGLVVRRRATLDRRDFEAEPPIVREQVNKTEPVDFKLDVVVPVSVGDRVVAVIAVGAPRGSLQVARTALEIVAEFGSVVLRALAARERADRFANQDPLTGVGNRTWFNATAAESLYRLRQEGGRAALVMFGVDHYQHYVRRNGHQAGDKLVRGVAQVLRPIAGDGDFLARWSGDEFVVLLPGADPASAWTFASRARQAIRSVEWPFAADQPGGRVTLCAAIAGFPASAPSLEGLVEVASQTLSEARAAGGDTTGSVLFDAESERLLAEATAAARAATDGA